MAAATTSSTLSPKSGSPGLTVRVGRDRSSSIVKVEKVGEESQEETLDQGVYDNVNAEWVNRKGAWVIHLVLIFAGKVVIDTIPGMRQEISWTLVNLLYLGLSYLMFHYVTGIPFHSDLHGGVYDNLTLWEQIDEGAQYTPSKKWLFIVPISLFLASTHYTHYDPWLFAVNLTALILVLIPKLPVFHRYRVRFMVDDDASGVATPTTPHFPRSGYATPSRENVSIPPITVSEVESRL
ncbi:Orm1 type endoplasmic reticulum protein [Trametes polyzona]|nr:Orm1 type endoplasmic reticulum protein [Trametes polyzona]